MVLVDAIMRKADIEATSQLLNPILQNLYAIGMIEEKLADMKIKALRIMGKAELKKKNYQQASTHLENAIGRVDLF